MDRRAAGFVWIGFLLLTVGSGIYVIWRTVDSLTPDDDLRGAVSSIWNLIALGVGCGVVAFTLIEFCKRLSPLRAWFNEREVERLRYDIENLDSELEYPFNVHANLASAFYESSRFLALDAPLEEVAAQLSNVVRDLLGIDSERDSGSESRDVYRAASRTEHLLDQFQIRAGARWRRLLRGLAALTASAIAGVAAMATDSPPSVVIGAFLFGWTIGGPFSWAVRDLVRVIEARAR